MIATYFFGGLVILGAVGLTGLVIYNHYVKKYNERLKKEEQ